MSDSSSSVAPGVPASPGSGPAPAASASVRTRAAAAAAALGRGFRRAAAAGLVVGSVALSSVSPAVAQWRDPAPAQPVQQKWELSQQRGVVNTPDAVRKLGTLGHTVVGGLPTGPSPPPPPGPPPPPKPPVPYLAPTDGRDLESRDLRAGTPGSSHHLAGRAASGTFAGREACVTGSVPYSSSAVTKCVPVRGPGVADWRAASAAVLEKFNSRTEYFKDLASRTTLRMAGIREYYAAGRAGSALRDVMKRTGAGPAYARQAVHRRAYSGGHADRVDSATRDGWRQSHGITESVTVRAARPVAPPLRAPSAPVGSQQPAGQYAGRRAPAQSVSR